jgi:Fe2+ transport system protein FeoA
MNTTAKTLDILPLGDWAVIQVTGGEGPLRYRLMEMGLVPGTAVQVVKVAPLGNPLDLRIRDHFLSLRREEARLIQVIPAPTAL